MDIPLDQMQATPLGALCALVIIRRDQWETINPEKAAGSQRIALWRKADIDRLKRLRRQGKTYAEIGALMALSVSVIREKCAKLKRDGYL